MARDKGKKWNEVTLSTIRSRCRLWRARLPRASGVWQFGEAPVQQTPPAETKGVAEPFITLWSSIWGISRKVEISYCNSGMALKDSEIIYHQAGGRRGLQSQPANQREVKCVVRYFLRGCWRCIQHIGFHRAYRLYLCPADIKQFMKRNWKISLGNRVIVFPCSSHLSGVKWIHSLWRSLSYTRPGSELRKLANDFWDSGNLLEEQRVLNWICNKRSE